MRSIIIVILVWLSTASFAQTGIDPSIEKVKTALEQYEPCNRVFCFEYSFHVNKEKKELEIKTLRYNYQGSPAKKILTETKEYKIAVGKIQAAMFYPGEEQSFIINASEIEQELNGKKELVDAMILDFNEDFVGKSASFEKNFNELVSQIKKL